jgi:hypothetical protein
MNGRVCSLPGTILARDTRSSEPTKAGRLWRRNRLGTSPQSMIRSDN